MEGSRTTAPAFQQIEDLPTLRKWKEAGLLDVGQRRVLNLPTPRKWKEAGPYGLERLDGTYLPTPRK